MSNLIEPSSSAFVPPEPDNPDFIIQTTRLDIFNNMVSNFIYGGEKLYTMIMSDNGIENSLSRRGDIFEAICTILIATKCIPGIEHEGIYDGTIETLHIVTDFKTLLKDNIHRGGNVVDLSIKQQHANCHISVKYRDGYGETDVVKIRERIKRIGNNDDCIGLIVKNKTDYTSHKYRDDNNSDKAEINKINDNNLLFDEKDIISGMCRFCDKFSGNINIERINSDYLGSKLKTIYVYLHQQITINKFVGSLYKNKNRKWCIAHKPRSGKSITILLMSKYLLENGHNKILIMTSVKDTLDSFISDLNKYVEFKHINYVEQDKFDTIGKNFKGIVLCSVQYLKNAKSKLNKKEFLKRIGFNVMFIDESHTGSSTEKTESEILDLQYIDDIASKIKFKVFASGTPNKTIAYFKIQPQYVYEWGMDDVANMKLIKDSKFYDLMYKRHGQEFINCFNSKVCNNNYDNVPIPILLKHEFTQKIVDDINNYNLENNTNFGLSWSSILALIQTFDKKANKVVYENKFELCKSNAGKLILINMLELIISNDPMKSDTIMRRIENTQCNYKSRMSSIEIPLLFIVYLPVHTRNGTINQLQKTLKQFIEDNKLWKDYNVEYSNSIDDSSSMTETYNNFIDTILQNTKMLRKIGCILLLGSKGTTGITYKKCDVTISLDDGHNIDDQGQRMSRSHTDDIGKTIAINVDMNVQRTYTMLYLAVNKHRKYTKSTKSNSEILRYLHQHNIFLFNPDCFNFGNIIEHEIVSFYKSFANEMSNQVDDTTILENIVCANDYLSNIIGKVNFSKASYSEANPELNGEQLDCPKGGTTRIQIDSKAPKPKSEQEQEEQEQLINKVNKTLELCKAVIFPLFALLSRVYNIDDFKCMLNNVNTKPIILSILKDKKIEINNSEYNILVEAMNTIIDINEEIVHNIREIYAIATPDRLRSLIEKHFIPSAEERKNNAEIPTPVKLVDKMLDIVPNSFWSKIHTVFEPCCGKGNFILGIFDKFYHNLEFQKLYPDPSIRCSIIIEKCLYFADLTALNVFITTELLKCHIQRYCNNINFEYKFNSYVGDTLQLNIHSLWNIKRFDAIIGNPPYNKNLYKKFTEYCIVLSDILLFVIPSTFTIGVSHNKFIDILKQNGLKYVNYLTKDDWTTTIDIDTLYLYCSSGYTGDIFINNIQINRNDKILNIDTTYYDIIQKIKNHSKVELFKGKNETLPHNNPVETDTIKFTQSLIHSNKLLSRLNGGRGDQIYFTSECKEDPIPGCKVLFPRGTGSYNSINTLRNLSKPIVYSKVCVETIMLSTGIVYIKCSNIDEANFMQWYLMNSKFCRFLFIKENKFSELTKGFVNIIPTLPYTNEYNDQYVYDYFKFNNAEVKFIENTILSK